MVEADKGGHWEKKKKCNSQCSVFVGGMGGGRGLLQGGGGKETVTQKKEASTCIRMKGELHRHIKSLFNADLETILMKDFFFLK